VLKVLLQSRTTLFTVPGGDTVQVAKTAEALRRKGCVVDISLELEPDVSAYDLVHLFNLTRPQEVYVQAANAKKTGKPLALSTIYVDFSEYDSTIRGGIAGFAARVMSPASIGYLKAVARAAKNGEINKGTLVLLKSGFKNLQSKIVDMTDVFLPNSESEMGRVNRDHPISKEKHFLVVPNGIDQHVFDAENITVTPPVEAYRGCVLSVARIEGLKNQLNLVRAMRDLSWPLLLIGSPAPNHRAYFDRIRKEAGPNVHFISHLDHELLPQYYKAAKVHALASWMETTGLSSLEAGAMGCNLVITPKGDTREYFGDLASYCEPGSVSSIRAAIINAYEAPARPALRERILKNFTWEKAADKTLEAYEQLLDRVGVLS
jgi:glycosyltransferase involved in cell wall biosynthesis